MNPASTQTTFSWYQSLNKPFFAPPSWVFGAVWSILYPIIFISFGYTFYQVFRNKYPRKIAIPFALNLIFNFAFSSIQFGLQNNILAAFDISLVITTLVWAIKAIYPYSKRIAFVQVPYLIWGLFATILQYAITALNW